MPRRFLRTPRYLWTAADAQTECLEDMHRALERASAVMPGEALGPLIELSDLVGKQISGLRANPAGYDVETVIADIEETARAFVERVKQARRPYDAPRPNTQPARRQRARVR